MTTLTIPGTGLEVSTLIYGCMRLPHGYDSAKRPLHAALDAGLTFFDHADIYGGGNCEAVFGNIWDDGVKRDDLVIQSKCGIRAGRYDFSYDHIMASVEGSLKRLRTDYLDILLLHRPDVLMDTDEVAEAFDELQAGGKVRYFGVSNFTPAQMALLQAGVNQRLVANQIRLSLGFPYAFDSYIVTGSSETHPATRGEGILEHAMLEGYTIQAYSPVAGGALLRELKDDTPAPLKAAAEKVASLAEELGVSREAVALAWLLRHPAGIQPVVGTVTPERIAASAQATSVELTREQWYELYVAARGQKLP